MRAFISYHTGIKTVAGDVSRELQKLDVETFLAHEDIEVSQQWQKAILRELKRCKIFVAILDKQYFESVFCVQESGIAVHRGMVIVPLSIDGTIPRGFIAHIQSRPIKPNNIDRDTLLAGISAHDTKFVIDKLIDEVGESGSFRGAESNFQVLLPYLDKATDQQIIRLLKLSNQNGQVGHASLCATKYLPPLMKSHGAKLDRATRKSLKETLARYN